MRWLWFTLAALAFGQQGHPLTGTWTGDWGTAPDKRNQITMVLNWDGKQVSGLLNPGPDSTLVSGVFVDPSSWTIRIEAEVKDKTHIAAEGRLEDIGSYHRTITGSWRQGTQRGDFRLTRD